MIAWSLFAVGFVVIRIVKSVRGARVVAAGLLLVSFTEPFLHDLDSLDHFYRIAALIAVAIIAIVASFVYRRLLLPQTKA
jgi:uncharacterized membrane protein